MDIAKDSVWIFNNVDGIPNGLYRILRLYSEIGELVIFRLSEKKTITRPILCSIEVFEFAYKEKRITEDSYLLPGYLLLSDIDIPEMHRKKRGERFDLIKPLLDDDLLYFDLATKKRVESIGKRAKEKSVYIQTLYRILNTYWEYGQDISSLTPAFKLQGGRGKIRIAGSKKRGAPVKSKTGAVELDEGINIKENDQKNIIKGLKKYRLNSSGLSTSKSYEKTILEYYETEVTEAEINNTFAKIPKEHQFRYWEKKLTNKDAEIKKCTNESDFQRNKRSLLSSAVRDALIPGECFEMDSTVADVHIVSKFNRNKCLGRPIIYLVIDKASRMIVGVHVSMEYASWRAGRQALINCFTKKKAYCEKFGINISDSEWPCFHIPRRILCDRGEMICKNPEELVVPLMQLDIAAPYRADMKGIVERRFKILNDEALHGLIGTTKGIHRVRGEADPRARAQYTIDEVTKKIIKEILKHNRRTFEKLIKETPLLIENDLVPTPINTWNIHLLKHRHSLKVADEEEVRAKLLPAVKASMTGEGIFYEPVNNSV
ncbi:DDE-type integrase/transposase/recombinase [Endozoicomonas atrinae]|uniref:DDE-type integrase/transposase/recombinase n=1 Tax=Endozoicomonas atrinae TaxID=1333660 RepID=UPI000ACD8DF6|nr:DDE-type integrase/transposase/recombinase [Endozoicomonas atrinae]